MLCSQIHLNTHRFREYQFLGPKDCVCKDEMREQKSVENQSRTNKGRAKFEARMMREGKEIRFRVGALARR